MKKVILSLTVMLLLTMAAEGSYVVFDNGVPEVYSDGKDIRSWLQADDFSITQNVILMSACFWTYEHDDQIWDGTLEYFIFDDDDGMPDTIIASGHGQSIQKNITYETPIGTQYKYSFEFEEPIDISSDDTYWFGLHLASDYPNDGGNVFKWESCISGFGLTSFESEGGTLDNWIDSSIHRAFYLEGIPEPATITVDDDGPADFNNIQAAIDDANDGDEVVVADGVYTGEGNRDIDFKGKAITVLSENGPENCIIDCNATEEEAHRGFYFHSGEGTDSILSGLTIINGRAPLFEYQAGSQTFNYWVGGAIFCYQGSPTISNCYLINNSADWFGGAMACWEAAPQVTECTITNNVSNSGGGVYASGYENPILSRCVISNNTAGCGVGGGLLSHGGTVLINCLLLGNRAEIGGAIFVSGDNFIFGNAQIRNCTITGNTAQWAGAVHCGELSCPYIVNSTLWGNYANNGAEIAMTRIDWGSSLSVKHSNIRGGKEGIFNVAPGLPWSDDNIDSDPCFIDPGYWADVNDPNIIVEPNDPNAIWVDGDYHLLEGSPCINAGDPNYIAEPNEMDLDGLPRIIGGRIDMGAYEFIPPVQAEMKIAPQMLSCKSRGNLVKAHFVLPEGFAPDDVDVNEPAFAELPQTTIDSEYIKLLGNDDGLVRLEIAFDRQAFCELLCDESIVLDNDSLEITVVGYLTTGQYFYGCDTIRIKHRNCRPRWRRRW